MSIAQIKIDQGFRKTANTCSNCQRFQKEVVQKEYKRWDGTVDRWGEDKSLRCGLGGFKVGKTNTCDKHELVQA
ncbi:hypothetical protein [Cupriavidus sp. RAF12]|uniref:hypothetical protein n=1 Tax=Cupriavidus sp. RAF12 TaxID=3233050 RepID=UPI003F8F12E2